MVFLVGYILIFRFVDATYIYIYFYRFLLLVGLIGLRANVVELNGGVAGVQDPQAAVVQLQLEAAVRRGVVAVTVVYPLENINERVSGTSDCWG